MNAHLKLLAAATIAAGTVTTSFAQDTPAERTKTEATAEKAAAGQGIHGTAAAPDAEGIRDVLAASTEAALTKDGFDDFVERLVDADRNRIGKAMPKEAELKAFNDLVTQFRADWKAKYNKDFDFPDKEEDVFKPEQVKIIQGEFGGAITAGARSSSDADTAAGRTAEKAVDATANAADKTAEAARQAAANPDANRETGRNNSVATIPASHGLPAVAVPLIHELPDAWRIDAPDTVDSAKLLAALQKHLGQVHSMKTQWPSDVNDAYLMVTHHLMLGVFEGTPNVQTTGGEARQAGDRTSPSGATPASPSTPASPASPSTP